MANKNRKIEEAKNRTVELLVRWNVPKLSYFKINTDGASNDLGIAGMGRVIRDDSERFKAAFAKHLEDLKLHNMAELQAIREGLMLARELKLCRVVVESESEYANPMLQRRSNPLLVPTVHCQR